jgi:hypothetical protein
MAFEDRETVFRHCGSAVEGAGDFADDGLIGLRVGWRGAGRLA